MFVARGNRKGKLGKADFKIQRFQTLYVKSHRRKIFNFIFEKFDFTVKIHMLIFAELYTCIVERTARMCSESTPFSSHGRITSDKNPDAIASSVHLRYK